MPELSTALVVGAGFLGTHLAQALAERGVSARVMTRSPLDDERVARLRGAELLIADASVRPALASAVEGVDHVFYCAGGLMPAESNLDPAADASLALPPVLNLLETLRAHPGPGLTFISSGGTVYGPPRRVPVAEDHPTEPVTSYGIMKLAAEKYVLMYARLYGLRARVLRCANAYGPYQRAARGQGFVAAVLEQVRTGRPVVMYGDGLNVRDFVYAPDVAHVMTELATVHDGPGVLNVGSGQGVSLRDVLTVVARVTGTEPELDRRPDRGFDVRENVLDVTALRRLVEPRSTPLEAGIRATWASVYRGVAA
jgi:UDP-glucose 4-epimerase